MVGDISDMNFSNITVFLIIDYYFIFGTLLEETLSDSVNEEFVSEI